MRYVLTLLFFIFLAPNVVVNAFAQTLAEDIVLAARERTLSGVRYDGKYMRLTYPGGDVPAEIGVCTDVIIRTYRKALGFDFQKAVHEDMKANFSAYPEIWGLSRTDRNIDHRRVPNLETFLNRQGARLAVTTKPENYLPGDLVTWRLAGNLPHIGVVSDRKTPEGVPLIIHNIGSGPKEDALLFTIATHRHYRFLPPKDDQP